MITADMLTDLEIFASLTPAERSDIALKAADVHVGRGEYVVREGQEPYFYVLLAGKLSVTKRVGTHELILDARERGGFFGESPILLGSDAFANLRADADSRVMRIDPLDFQALTVLNAGFRERILGAMTARLSALQTRATQKRAETVLVVGDRWDLGCRNTRTLLGRNQVRHEFLIAGEPSTVSRFPESADRHDLPLIRLVDGQIVANPSTRELALAVGLQVAPLSDAYDVVIIGGGPAGLAAAVYGASEGLRTLMIEREAPGGQAGTSSRIENYLGFPNGVSGDDLGSRALEQAKRLGAEIVVTRDVVALDVTAKRLTLDGGDSIATSSFVLATGVDWRELAIDGIERLSGVGVYYGASRGEARNTTGKDIFLIGGGNSAGQAAMFFANYARSVTILIRRADLTSSMSDYLIRQLATQANVRVQPHSEVRAVHGDLHLDAIDIIDRSTGETSRYATDALFVFIGADAVTDWLPAAIARDARGYVLTGRDVPNWTLDRDPFLLESSVPGVFAVGDVRHGSVKRVASAVGEGSMAIAFIHQYLAAAPAA